MPRFIPRLFLCGGATGIRTPDLLRAKQPLSHLSYRPETKRELSIFQFSTFLVGVGGLEPPTSILSGSRSNLLSYTPPVVLYHTRAKHATLRSRDDKIPRCCVAVKQKNGSPPEFKGRQTSARVNYPYDEIGQGHGAGVIAARRSRPVPSPAIHR